jgi:hypothetical protein
MKMAHLQAIFKHLQFQICFVTLFFSINFFYFIDLEIIYFYIYYPQGMKKAKPCFNP